MGGEVPEKPLAVLLRLSRPLFLAGGALMYALGAGIADYLGAALDWRAYLLGQTWVVVLQLGGSYLNAYYDLASEPLNAKNRIQEGAELNRPMLLAAAAACLTGAASLSVVILRLLQPGPAAFLILAVLFLGAALYSLPPVRLESSGYGELTVTILVVTLLPALAFVLQRGELHRLLAMSTFPLAAVYLAMMLALELPEFRIEHGGRRNLLARLGWEEGVRLHNLLVVAAFLLMALAVSFGLPLPIALPFFFLLPVGIAQIWQMRRIAAGAPPNWKALTVGAKALFAAAAYLLAYAFWTR